MSNPILSIENFTLKKDGKLILKEMNLTGNSEDWIEIVGRNNSGKSLLLNSIYGFHYDINGRMKFMNHEFDKLNVQEWRKKIGIYSNSVPLLKDKTLRANLSIALSIQNESLEGDEYLQKILTQLGLNEKLLQAIESLSDSEKSLAMLVRALVTKSKLVLLDCPFRNLDKLTQRTCVEILKDYAKKNAACILICTDEAVDYAPENRKLFVLESGVLKPIKT
ncbi:MAG: ATP-binding cassette domain-containing protein [Saprospiraceae bacterium]|nr:ATP-binding cassette domain-containing protein [Saprospiraceae bacterium]